MKIRDEWLLDLPQQFLDKHNIEVLIEAFAKQLEEIQAVFYCLNNNVDIDSAIGVNLDNVGTIIPLTRKEATSLAVINFDFKGPLLTDETYRKYLKYKNLRDTNECTYYDIMEGISLLWDIDGARYGEDAEHPATIILDMPINSKTIKIGDVPMIKPAGVAIRWNYKISTDEALYTALVPITTKFEILNPLYNDIVAGNLFDVRYAGYMVSQWKEVVECEVITPVPSGGGGDTDIFGSAVIYADGVIDNGIYGEYTEVE